MSQMVCIVGIFSIVLKVCHSSVFQTIFVRSVYIKIINYSCRILAHLNSTMQTKQRAMKTPHSYSNKNKINMGLIFVVEVGTVSNIS